MEINCAKYIIHRLVQEYGTCFEALKQQLTTPNELMNTNITLDLNRNILAITTNLF